MREWRRLEVDGVEDLDDETASLVTVLEFKANGEVAIPS